MPGSSWESWSFPGGSRPSAGNSRRREIPLTSSDKKAQEQAIMLTGAFMVQRMGYTQDEAKQWVFKNALTLYPSEILFISV